MQHFGHQETDFSRGVELAAGFACPAGEVADQVFIGIAEKVVRDVGAVKLLAAEVVDEVDQLVSRQLVLFVEVDLAGEDILGLQAVVDRHSGFMRPAVTNLEPVEMRPRQQAVFLHSPDHDSRRHADSFGEDLRGV